MLSTLALKLYKKNYDIQMYLFAPFIYKSTADINDGHQSIILLSFDTLFQYFKIIIHSFIIEKHLKFNQQFIISLFLS